VVTANDDQEVAMPENMYPEPPALLTTLIANFQEVTDIAEGNAQGGSISEFVHNTPLAPIAQKPEPTPEAFQQPPPVQPAAKQGSPLFVWRDGTVHGPFERPNLIELLRSGQLGLADMAAEIGSEEWKPIFALVGLPKPPLKQE
jgi:hypothetical protein